MAKTVTTKEQKIEAAERLLLIPRALITIDRVNVEVRELNALRAGIRAGEAKAYVQAVALLDNIDTHRADLVLIDSQLNAPITP